MANSTHFGVWRSTEGLKHVTIAAATGTETEITLVNSTGAFVIPTTAIVNGSTLSADGDELNRLQYDTKTIVYDDFLQSAVANEDWVSKWLAFAGATATTAAIVLAPEGKLDLVSGTNGTAGVTDCACMSSVALTSGQAVSLGKTVFEARVSASHITGATICVGLSDKIVSDSAEAVLHTVKTATIADDGLTVTDALSFCQDSEATLATTWYCTSENGGTIAYTSAAASCSSGTLIVADTYQVLRIEVDATGDARYYIDGTLVFTETTAVATTAVLVPYIAVTAEDGTPVATTLSVDYIYYEQVRNPSNA